MLRTIGDNHKDFSVLLKEFDKDLPLFLFGHSMGSAILISFLINNPSLKVAGVIASAPPLGMNQHVDYLKKGFAHYVLPELKEFLFTAAINVQAISRKPELWKYFLTNRLIVPAVGGP